MLEVLRKVLLPLASLRLTLVCLLLAMGVIFIGTLAQVNEGLYLAQDRYFKSWVVTVPMGDWNVPVLPGGHLLGWLLVINLLAAHTLRFRARWSQLGIHCIHLGLVLLIVGQLVADQMARESQFSIEEGKTVTFSESPREAELVFQLADWTGSADGGGKIVIAAVQLRPGRVLQPEGLPFDLHIREWIANAAVEQERNTDPDLRGAARQLRVIPEPRETRLDRRDLPVVEFEVRDRASGADLGVWIAPLHLDQLQNIVAPGLPDWEFQLRPVRRTHPFQLTLEEFVHDRYPGSEIPQRFASHLILERDGAAPRPVKIHMNHPLRVDGRTIYQASFADEDTVSILQVVENPVWVGPYVACALVAFGLLWHFGVRLRQAGERSKRSRAGELASPDAALSVSAWGIPAAALGFLLLFWIWQIASFSSIPARLASLPVQAHGRVQPVEQLARDTLVLLSGRDSVETENGKISATEWLWEKIRDPEQADQWKVFQIQHPDVLALVGAEGQSPRRFSFADLQPYFDAIREQAASVADDPETDPFRRAVLRLDNSLHFYVALRFSFRPPSGRETLAEDIEVFAPMIPAALDEAERWKRQQEHDEELLRAFAAEGSSLRHANHLALIQPAWPDAEIFDEWMSLPGAMLASAQARHAHAAPERYAELLRESPPGRDALAALEETLAAEAPNALHASRSEALFGRLAMFPVSGWLFFTALLLSIVALQRQWTSGRVAAWHLAVIGFAILTIGLVLRTALMQRPPVTNLYSSALFVAWAGALVGLLVERRYRNGLAVAGTSALAAVALLIASGLGRDSDPMGVLVAVLNSNFWLGTHVLVITIGYGAAFLAGFLGLAYLLARVLSMEFFQRHRRQLSGGIYGVLCFSLFFTFTGTVLGGIWADQSWGRFWGWDPKENGALLIVLWTALILHGRLAGSLRETGVAVMAVLGNIVVAFSWFGTNLLGIGLHSYGFTEQGFFWLCAFVVSQLALAGLGWLPEKSQRLPKEGV